MALEIERKFLVKDSSAWQALPRGALMRQGYLHSGKDRVVRVRIEGELAWLTVKGAMQGIVRGEWEYPVPFADATEMLSLCDQLLIEKYRYRIPFDNLLWELDVFVGMNAGLVVAEIELDSETQLFKKPDWVGEEVTGDSRYLNSNLIRHPYSTW